MFWERGKKVRFHIPEGLDNDPLGYTHEPQHIDTDDAKGTFDPKRFLQDERSSNQEDKVSETKISEAATLTNGKSESVHPLEDRKKSSSSELEHMLERKDTNDLVSFVLNKKFMPGPPNAEANEREIIIDDELIKEEEIDTSPPELKSNEHEKGRHIKTDSEFIHEMLYSSDSSDSFEKERTNML